MKKHQVFTKTQRLEGSFDLSEALSARSDVELILFESADNATKQGEKSWLFIDLALRVQALEHEVHITVLLEEAKLLLDALAERFSDHVLSREAMSLSLRFKPLYDHLDLLQKMRALSALDVLRYLKSIMHADDVDQKKALVLAGAFSYDFLDHFEKLPTARKDIHELPDYIFYFPLTVIRIDHPNEQTHIYAHSLKNAEAMQARFDEARALAQRYLVQEPCAPDLFAKDADLSYEVDIKDKDFLALVDVCKEHIRAGDVYQIVPSRTFSRSIKDEINCYRILKRLNPSPYMFFVRSRSWTLFGASPETFIKIDEGGQRVAVRPIAGTRRRGFSYDGRIDHELDAREQASLCLDEKELAEHMMLVDLARNDIAAVAKPKSRRIKRLLGVDRYSHVMHLVSEVEGELADFDALSAYQSSMNMGTLMGAPKVRAAELLRVLEHSKRGFYGGAVGYLDATGDMDTAIIIRSALVKNGVAHVRAGCGVVFDSTPEFETQETINKAEAVLRALAIAGGA